MKFHLLFAQTICNIRHLFVKKIVSEHNSVGSGEMLLVFMIPQWKAIMPRNSSPEF